MIDTENLRSRLCKSFCGDLSVKALPSGVAVTTRFRDAVNDPIACFIEQDAAGWYLADDGQFLPDIVARGIEIQVGSRKEFLDRILASAGASIDLQNLEIRTSTQQDIPKPDHILQFITALARARDVAFWSRERVRSTFKDDAYMALVERFKDRAEVSRGTPVDASLNEFPADAVLRPRVEVNGHPPPTTAVFFVQALDAMNEALMLWMEAREKRRSDIRVTALIEDSSINLSSYKAQRAVNRVDAIAIFRGDEAAAIDRIERVALPVAA